MLQEIINRIDKALHATQKKMTDIFFDVTIGLFKGYRDKLLELARITATTYYLQAVRMLRYFSIVIFCVIAEEPMRLKRRQGWAAEHEKKSKELAKNKNRR